MNKVKEFLDLASKEYYTGNPIISDEQFDMLASVSNYTAVGYNSRGNTYKHMFPMFSLQKYYVDENAEPLKGYKNKVPSFKLDGAAISLLYIDGSLHRVLTRGDGIEGIDVTEKFLKTNIVPTTISGVPKLLQITGELAAPLHIENARNYAAGALNLNDVSEFQTRALSFFAYGVQPVDPSSTFTKDMQMLMAAGFDTVLGAELDQVYPCDGIVFRLDSNKEFLELGYTAKHPRGAYALKERKEHVETTLLGVEWQVGKSGKVTPVAILEPVKYEDVTISRATLNNPAFIEMLDLRIGDRVAVIRAGEIIPCIIHKVE